MELRGQGRLPSQPGEGGFAGKPLRARAPPIPGQPVAEADLGPSFPTVSTALTSRLPGCPVVNKLTQ